jgi:NOL1/NOP2/fmu family ribosome biogenesis protein
MGCAQRQSLILEQAARLARPGGRVVYSTCTFAPEEDEGVIARFLDSHPDFDLSAPPAHPGFSPGRPDWVGDARAVAEPVEASPINLTAAVRLWPHTGPGEGHFIAVLRRRADTQTPDPPPKPWRSAPLPRPVEQVYRAFCEANLAIPPAVERLALVGSYLYALPADLPDLSGLRFLHPGRWLGVVKKDRFEPSHALALRLQPSEARRCVDLPVDSAELRAYLRGEGFHNLGEDGWLLVAAGGFPLGWGKRVGAAVKSHYPKGLRWI